MGQTTRRKERPYNYEQNSILSFRVYLNILENETYFPQNNFSVKILKFVIKSIQLIRHLKTTHFTFQ